MDRDEVRKYIADKDKELVNVIQAFSRNSLCEIIIRILKRRAAETVGGIGNSPKEEIDEQYNVMRRILSEAIYEYANDFKDLSAVFKEAFGNRGKKEKGLYD